MRSALAAALLVLVPGLALAAEPAQRSAEQKAAEGKPAEQKPAEAKPASPHGPGGPAMAQPPKPMSPAEVEKTLYAVGLAVWNNLEVFGLTQAELDTVLKGIRDGWSGKPKVQFDAKMQAAVNDLARSRAPKAAEKAAAREKSAGVPYLAKMAKEKGANRSPSGAIVIPVKDGTGPAPTASDKVKVHYTGTLVSGRVFDSSMHRGPTEFTVGGVIKCWTEALQMMKVGAKAKVVCPSDIAYGASGTGAIPGNAVLTFDVELLEIVK